MVELGEMTTKELLERLSYIMKTNHKSYKSGMKGFLEKFDRLYKREKKLQLKVLSDLQSEVNSLREKVEILDETFLCIYDNIKRNQFLYAHYPEEWDQTFLQMKEDLKKQNKEFKIA